MYPIYASAAAVTPHDTNPSIGSIPCDALYVGGAGALVATINGTDVTFAAVPAGTILPVKASAVKATGTTATSIVALFGVH